MRKYFGKLLENVRIKYKNKHVANKGLTHTLNFVRVFKVEWIKTILSQIHDMKLLLEDVPMKITKKIIHHVKGFHFTKMV